MQGTIGVLGGMGPEATARFFDLLIRLTPAERDQDHLRIMVVNDPKIPDRTDYLKGKGESPVPALLSSARRLESLGCDLISIPCNTAHVFWKEIQQSVQIPVLHIIEETAAGVEAQLRHRPPGGHPSRVGLLATEGTVASRLYQEAFEEKGFLPLEPNQGMQAAVSRSIAWIKGNRQREDARRELEEAIREFERDGAEAVVLGCTELGLVCPAGKVPILDSLSILAEATIRRALGASDH